MYFWIRLVFATLAMVLGFLTAVPAAKADCPDGWSTDVCDPDGVNICSVAAGVWTCDLTRTGDTSEAEAYMIYDPDNLICTEGDYCAFGRDADGNDFCCELDPGEWSGASLNGGSFGDRLYLQYDDETYGEFDLEGWDSDPEAEFDGLVYGYDGQDWIYGSRYSTDHRYKDILLAGDGADHVYAEDGYDVIYGGESGDYLYGGPGEDWVFGEAGVDYIWGEGDNDHLDGGPDNDYISAGSGQDTCHGQGGDDVVCGDGDDDSLLGDVGNDSLWGDGGTSDVATGGPGTDDSCNAETWSCEHWLTSRPACP